MSRIATFLRKCNYIIMNKEIEYVMTFTMNGNEHQLVYDYIEEAREARADLMHDYGLKGIVISTKIKC